MEINDIGTDVFVLSCGALERSNNLYIESIVGIAFLTMRKRSSLYGFSWEENPKKELRQWKRYLWAESEISVFACVRKRNNSFDSTAVIFKAY